MRLFFTCRYAVYVYNSLDKEKVCLHLEAVQESQEINLNWVMLVPEYNQPFPFIAFQIIPFKRQCFKKWNEMALFRDVEMYHCFNGIS